MAESDTNSDLVAELAEEFVERYRAGERPALSEYIENYPAIADEIRDVFPALAMVENLAPENDASVFYADRRRSDIADSAEIRQLGDFHIIREVGRGGMGIVYEAEQESLGRRVALKVLPKQMLLDPKQKKRFQREAKAAAQLHHTNIVPVFGVGEHEGLQYYAMQFIHGLGLDEVLDELKQMRSGQPPVTADAPAATIKRPARIGRDVSAVAVAQSLLTGEFAPTMLFAGEDSGQDSQAGEGEAGSSGTAASDVNQQSSTLRPPRSALKDTATPRMSDTCSLSGAVKLPGRPTDGRKSDTKTTY